MAKNYKFFLYSMSLNGKHIEAMEKLTGKKTSDIKFACIENAADIIEGSENWVPHIRQTLIDTGYQVEAVDLRNWLHNKEGLYDKLRSKDVIWLGGGHTYYLRWILKACGADHMIKELVAAGKVYAGWSAGAIMAGPTTRFFDLMGDSPGDAPEQIEEGLELTGNVIVPHMNHAEFSVSALATNQALLQAGFKTIPLNDNQAFIMNGDTETII
jgi:dipeptidase E